MVKFIAQQKVMQPKHYRYFKAALEARVLRGGDTLVSSGVFASRSRRALRNRAFLTAR